MRTFILICCLVAVALAQTCTEPVAVNGINPCDGKCPCQGTSDLTSWEGIACVSGGLDPAINVICPSNTILSPQCRWNSTACACRWRIPTLANCPVTATCAALVCSNSCPNGRLHNSAGCEICDCKPVDSTSPAASVSCPALVCSNTCPNGRMRNSNNCEICDCQTATTTPASTTSTASCPALVCNNTCPNGRKRDSNNCEICDCKSCDGAVCPQIACLSTQKAVTPPNSCCPFCWTPPTCDFACPNTATSCPVNTVPATDACGCPTCIPKPVCPLTACVNPNCPVGFELTTHPDRCCPSCEPRLNCSLVQCNSAPSVCPTGSKLTVEDGQCCPTCEEVSPCANITCDTSPCGTGFERKKVDGFCCPVCLPTNRCDSVVCPASACPIARTTLRDGSCCYACSPCRAAESARKVCDRNDNLVCRPEFTGPNCEQDVPLQNLHRKDFEVKVLNTSEVPDGDTALWHLLDRARDVPREWVEIHQVKKRGTTTTLTGSVTCPASDASCLAAVSKLQTATSTDSTVQVNNASPAVVTVCSFALVALLAAAALLM